MSIDTNWHSKTPEALAEELGTDLYRGLHPKEAAKRLSKNGHNHLWRVKRASVLEAALRTLLDLSTLVLLVVAVIAAIFEKTTEFVAIFTVVTLGGAARVALHVRTQRIFEEKARGVIPRVTIIRNSQPLIHSAENLVVGDVVMLYPGDTVPGDARIISTPGVFVYENKMTDNKSLIFKNADTIVDENGVECPIEKRDNMLYAGSTIVSGEARALIVALGGDTLAAAKFGTLTIPSGEKLKISEKLTSWSRVFGIASLAAILVITVAGAAARGGSALEVLLSAAALSAAAMSEAFPIIGAYALAAAVRKADGEDSGRAKVKNAASVGDMNNADTIVLESPIMIKAGDITLNSYYDGRRLVNVDEPGEGSSPAELLKLCYVTTGILPQGTFSPAVAEVPREETSFGYAGIRKVFDEYFDRSYESRTFENTVLVGHEPSYGAESGGLDTALICRGGNFEAIVSGVVDAVLSCCTNIRKGGKVCPITRDDVAKIRTEVDSLRKRGVFTVGVARRDSPYVNMNRVSALQMCMTFEGFLALSDRPYGDALDAIRKCREGDACRMVCFTDGSDEDRAFLEMVGFIKDGDRYITYEEMVGADRITLEPGQFAAISVGARDGAKMRREAYKKLRLGGCSAVYVSRDASDMWLMKEATVSVAVPAASKISKTIPQSIRSSSDVIVTPKSGGGVFEAFRVVELAKGAFMNMRRCANYLLASNVAKLFLVLVASFMKDVSPASPVALLLWGLLVDLAVAFVSLRRDPPWNIISVDKSAHELQKAPKDFAFAVVSGAAWGLVLLLIPAALSAFEKDGISSGVVMNLVFSSALFSIPVVGIEMMTNGTIFKKSKRRSGEIPLLFFACAILALLFALTGLSSVIGAEKLTFKQFLLTLIPGVVSLISLEIYKIATKNGRSGKIKESGPSKGE